MKKSKNDREILEVIINEQGILGALRSLASPFLNAIDNLKWSGQPDDEKAIEWDEIKNQINDFFSTFPEIAPKTEEEIAKFETWLNKYRDKLTRNNVKAILQKAFLKYDVEFARQVGNIIKNLLNTFPKLFEAIKANESDFERLFKRTLQVSGGDLAKAKGYIVKFILLNAESLLGYEYEQVVDGISKAIGALPEAIAEKFSFMKYVYNMKTTYPQFFAKIGNKDEMIKKLFNREDEDQKKYLLELLSDHTNELDRDKLKLGFNKNVELIAKMLELDEEFVASIFEKGVKKNKPIGRGPGVIGTRGEEFFELKNIIYKKWLDTEHGKTWLEEVGDKANEDFTEIADKIIKDDLEGAKKVDVKNEKSVQDFFLKSMQMILQMTQKDVATRTQYNR